MERKAKPDCPGWWWIRDERYGGSTEVVHVIWDSDRICIDKEFYESDECYDRPDRLCWRWGDNQHTYVDEEPIAWAEGPLPVPEG